jgi:HK97 family phage major capsid protein/HK97 family phage prohead protease
MPKPLSIPQALAAHLNAGRAERSLKVERQAIDETARTATLAFASETPYERFWGIEILDCTPGSMRTGRLQSGANLLCDHDATDVVGVVESVEIGADRVGRAVVRFGKSARAEEVWQDVRDGIRRNVSFGYMIHKAILVETVDGVDTYRVTDFEPFEISLVSVPADASVGVGRSADTTTAQARSSVSVTVEVEINDDEGAPDAEPCGPADTAPESDIEDPTLNACALPNKSLQPQGKIMSEVITAPAPEVRNHAAEISKVAAAFPGTGDLALSAIQRGLTVEQFQREALDKLATAPLPTSDIGLSQKEVRQYSVMRAINALVNPGDRAAQEAAGFERAASDAVAKKMGKASRGFFLPTDVQKRDLTAGTTTAGGFSVSTDLRPQDFIQALRNAMVIDGLGARMLTGLTGSVAIPKQSGAATAYWVAENTAPTESQQTLAQVTLSPKTVGAFTDISRRLLLQSSIDVENMVQTDLATVLGLAIQQAAINGAGGSAPTGLLTAITPGIIGGTNGLAPTWQNMIDLETAIASANADVGSMAYLTNAKVRGKLKSTQKFATTNGAPVWDLGANPINGYNAAITNGVPSNLTKGTSSGICSAIMFGNFSDLVIGMWGTLDLLVDPYTGSSAGTVRVVTLQDVDVAIRNVESFATMVDALTT